MSAITISSERLGKKQTEYFSLNMLTQKNLFIFNHRNKQITKGSCQQSMPRTTDNAWDRLTNHNIRIISW